MPDIFGRHMNQYRHLADLETLRPGAVGPHLVARAAERGHSPHNFNALQPRMRNDLHTRSTQAQGIGYVTDNLQAIMTMIEEIHYTRFMLDQYVPLVTDIPEGATTYAYVVMDSVGEAALIANSGQDAPSAAVGVTTVPASLYYAGIIPQWTYEELRQAMFAGVALNTEVLSAAIMGAFQHIEKVGLNGGDIPGAKGLINQDVEASGDAETGTKVVRTLRTTTVGPWLEGTDARVHAENARKDITDAIGKIIENTATVFGQQGQSGLTVYLPVEKFNWVTTHPMGDNADKSIWNYVSVNNPWTFATGQPVKLCHVINLKEAGWSELSPDTTVLSRTKVDRMIVAVNDRSVMEMAIPIYPRPVGVHQNRFSVEVPIEHKLSSLNVKRFKAIRYHDNI